MASRVRAAALLAFAAGIGGFTAGQPARAAEVSIECRNPASGATWQIKVDYDKKTVDANPAEVSATEISWRDRKDGYKYTLDRNSGKLTVVFASSTGGNFFFDRCKLGG